MKNSESEELPQFISELILKGDKIGAIKAYRDHVGCSLGEAKRIIDEFDEHLGVEPGESNRGSKGSKQIIAESAEVGILGNLIFIIFTDPMLKALRAHLLAKGNGIIVAYDDLRTHQLIGGNPVTWVKGFIRAREKGLNPELYRVAAMQLTLSSDTDFFDWIDQGMPEGCSQQD